METPSTVNWQTMLQDYIANPTFSEMELDQAKGFDQEQLPSPPLSNKSDYAQVDPEQLVSISTTFYPAANHESLGPGNLILRSQDGVHFYCHAEYVRSVSDNGFDGILSTEHRAEKVITVQEHAGILNILLHTIYNLSCAHYAPAFEDIESTLSAMQKYGISIRQRITPSSHLFQQIMGHAQEHALDIYALAGSYDLYRLAESVSPYLLTINLSDITDELSVKMGPMYLKRLFFLHFGRSEALKRLLLHPPNPHSPTSDCTFDEQRKVTRAWALASAYIAWDAKPDLSPSAIEVALMPLGDHLTCQLCKKMLRERVESLNASWSEIKVGV